MSSSSSHPVPDLELIKKRVASLSDRQRLVLRLELVEELPNQTEIGKRMGIKQGSVSDHRKSALEKLGISADDLTGLAVVKLALEQTPIKPAEQQILDANRRRPLTPSGDGDASRAVGTQMPPVTNGQSSPPKTGFGPVEQGIEDSRVAPPPPRLNWRLLAIGGGILAVGLVLGWLSRPPVVEQGGVVVVTPTPGPTQTPVVVTQIATPNSDQIAAVIAQTPTPTPPPPIVQTRIKVATPTPGPTPTPIVITATPEPVATSTESPPAGATPTPNATQSIVIGNLTLPFIDRFDNLTRRPEWQVKSGLVIAQDGALSSDGATISIGDEALRDFTLDLTHSPNATVNFAIGDNFRTWRNFQNCYANAFIDNQWRQIAQYGCNYNTRLKFSVSSGQPTRVRIYVDDTLVSSLGIDNLDLRGPIQLTFWGAIDNVSLTSP